MQSSKISEVQKLTQMYSTIDVHQYGLSGFGNQTTTSWANRTIPGPVLNITAFYFQSFRSKQEAHGYHWTDPRTKTVPTDDPRSRTYIASDGLYTVDDINQNGKCQPVIDSTPCGTDSDLEICHTQRYTWGFSYVQLFLNTIALILWTTGIYTMWRKARFQLPLAGYPQVPRGWAAVLELGRAIEQELCRNGIDTKALTDRQLRREIRKYLKGGSVLFEKAKAGPEDDEAEIQKRSLPVFVRGPYRGPREGIKRRAWRKMQCIMFFGAELLVAAALAVVLFVAIPANKGEVIRGSIPYNRTWSESEHTTGLGFVVGV